MKAYLVQLLDNEDPIITEVESSLEAVALWNLRANAALEVCRDILKRAQPQKVDMTKGVAVLTWTIPK